MPKGGHVVLLDLFAFFPGLPSADWKDLVELTSVVEIVESVLKDDVEPQCVGRSSSSRSGLSRSRSLSQATRAL